ncbi:MAG: ABC transporter substrate-binding protein, partial [Candidatus Rokuibacteriota bacterium]
GRGESLTRKGGVMDRREFLAGSLALLAMPRAAAAQHVTKLPRVGYLFSFTPSSGRHLWDACRQGMRDLGYVEGQSVILEPRWADGRHERLPSLVADLLRLKVDVIVAAATPANVAAKKATSTVPIVMVAVAEPVKAGLVASLARPGANVTGLTLLTPELSGKRLELLAEVLAGKVPRVAVLTNPANFSHTVFLEETRVAAQRTGTELQTLAAQTFEDLESSFETAAREQASALIVFDDPVLWSHRKHIVALAARRRFTVMYGYREFVDEGGLMSYGPSRPDLYRRTALYVDKILKGANPADLPVERPTKFEFIINLKTAKALSIAIPPALLVRADELIE